MSGAPVVKVEYEELDKVSQEFQRHSEIIARMNARLTQQFNVLLGGAWVGANAEKFYAEMEGDVLPAVRALKSVLGEASIVTTQIIRIFQEAEEDAGNAFPGDGGTFSSIPKQNAKAVGGDETPEPTPPGPTSSGGFHIGDPTGHSSRQRVHGIL